VVDLGWSLRPATPSDAGWLADLKVAVMRPDLERLGYWDRDWASERFLDRYDPTVTTVIVLGADEVGCIAVRPERGHWWIEHFYLRRDAHRGGVCAARSCGTSWRHARTVARSCWHWTVRAGCAGCMNATDLSTITTTTMVSTRSFGARGDNLATT